MCRRHHNWNDRHRCTWNHQQKQVDSSTHSTQQSHDRIHRSDASVTRKNRCGKRTRKNYKRRSFIMNWKGWLYTLLSYFVGGASTALSAALALPQDVNWTPAGL